MSNDSTSSTNPITGNQPIHFSVGPPGETTDSTDENTADSPTQTAADDIGAAENESIIESAVDSKRDIESELIDQTKTQIRTLVQEITELSRSQCSTEDFFEGFLSRATSALASVGGAIWVRDSADQPLKLRYHINLKQTKLATDSSAQTRHSLLLNKLVELGQPALISPNTGSDSSDAGNPTESLLVFGPLSIDNETIGMVEIFQRPNAGPTTQRGYLRFVTQMSLLASEFLSNQRIRSFADQQAMWQQLEQFISTVHQGLDTRQTVYTIANEGRRLTESDRVSVALGTGRNCKIEAVSGLDSIERRAAQVKKLGVLAATVIKTGQPLWYDGDDADLPPQIEKRLHEYVDQSHCKMLAIVPLKKTRPADASDGAAIKKQRRQPAQPIGAVIIEQLKDSRITPALQQRTEVLVSHGETALGNTLDHNGIFLMPVWKVLGSVTSIFRGGKLFKTMTLLIAVAGLAAFLAVYPYPFGLGAKGSLVPQTQEHVFAQVDGVLQEIHVSNTGDSFVQPGQLLAVMTNNDLMVEIENLRGRIREAKEKLRTNEIIRSQKRLEPIDREMIAGEIATARQMIASINNELQLKLEEAELLNVVSPVGGQVVNWQVRQNLLRRPVLRGQNLMTIIDPKTQWQIELELPERRLAHLIRAVIDSDQPLEVTFGLVSHPGVEYTGTVMEIDRQLAVHSDDGNTALVRIGFPNKDIQTDLLRAGTRVTAKIHCGSRSIGYVMFHELIETVQSSVLFWL